MKIRIKGNSIRYRLTKTEVEKFCTTGYVAENTQFPKRRFTYALQAKESIEKLEATFEADAIIVFLSKNKSIGWEDNDTVGFSHTMPLETGQELFLLVEKDFVCLDETIEDQSDNYPNPLADKK